MCIRDSYWNEEPDEKGCYTMRDLKDGETAGELKSKNELLGDVYKRQA